MRVLKVKSIRPAGIEPVYNMEVDTHHNFSVEGGVIVHNCYDSSGYGLLSYHAKISKPQHHDNRAAHIKYRDKIAARASRRRRNYR